MKLFVDCDADTRLSRRVLRDMKDFNRPLDNILNYYQKYVKPAFEEFCLPTKKYADVIIPRYFYELNWKKLGKNLIVFFFFIKRCREHGRFEFNRATY